MVAELQLPMRPQVSAPQGLLWLAEMPLTLQSLTGGRAGLSGQRGRAQPPAAVHTNYEQDITVLDTFSQWIAANAWKNYCKNDRAPINFQAYEETSGAVLLKLIGSEPAKGMMSRWSSGLLAEPKSKCMVCQVSAELNGIFVINYPSILN